MIKDSQMNKTESAVKQITPPAIGKKERNSNLELYRIIVMLAIVAHHFVVNSGLLEILSISPLSGKSIFSYCFGVWGKTGINCFVLITGYFMCKSEITPRKFLKLLFEIYFYSIVINLIFIVSGYTKFSLGMIFFALFPVQGFSNNFVSCFLVYYLCIPFLNILIEHLTQKKHLLLVQMLVIVYTIVGSIPLIGFEVEYISWFAIMHLVASYIRIYGFPIKMGHVAWLWLALCFILLSFASIIIILYLGRIDHWSFFLDSPNKFLAFATSISLFMWFKDAKVKQSKIINRISASAFGVLLIHANSDTMRQWLWKDVLDVSGHYPSDCFMIYSVLSVLGIYMVCTIIDQLRIVIFEKPFFKLIDNSRFFDRF